MHRSLDAHRHPESRAIADDDELRRCPPNSAQFWGLGYLRPWFGKPEPARLHCVVSGWSADTGKPELEIGVSSRFLPGDADRHTGDADRKAYRKHTQQCDYVRRTAPRTGS